MSINNFPTALQPLIQQNFLERMFTEGLTSKLGYRLLGDAEVFPSRIGETLTKTRYGHKAPVTAPLNPANNTNLDNGLTPASNTIEQYTMTLYEYADTTDLNIVNQNVGLEKQFLMNARVNGVQAIQSLNRRAQKYLFDAYLGGNTRVTATLGAPAVTIAVDDIRGYQNVVVNGQVVPISGTNTMQVLVGSTVYTLTTATADVTNVSTAPGGISGTLTFSTNVSTANGTIGNAVVSLVAPSILRPNARATSTALTTSDYLTMSVLMDAVTVLNNNAIPTRESGMYDCVLDPASMRQLFADPEFQLLFRGTELKSPEYRNLIVSEALNMRFIVTTEAYQQTNGAVKIHRPIICGANVLVEGRFQGMTDAAQNLANGPSVIDVVDGVAQVTRMPLDRLGQIIAQSWYGILGWAVPTDVTANQSIIPTANNSYFKRAVVVEHGGA